SPLAILAIRTSSEVVGIGRAIDSSVRQPGGAQVQDSRENTLRGWSGRRVAGSLPQVSPFRRSWASLRAATGHIEGFQACPHRTGSFRQGIALNSPAENLA
ncbi:MAG TPA: hypothetical protein VNU65_13130, partial [Xanthobacteraceae bacterium]|nr:hypothetical protein [Xanthobacteraceae bacterium]